jgi:hypothetical protein
MAECDWLLLCDYAFPDIRGKLCIIGVFDAIYAPKLPAKHERSVVAFNIIGEPGEKVPIRLEIVGPSGKSIAKAQLETTLPDAGGAQVHIQLSGLVLKEFGRHAILLDIGGGAPKEAWFTLLEQQPP